MRRHIKILAIVLVLGIAFSCGGNAVMKSKDGAVKRAAAPVRNGWYGQDLYGDVASITQREYTLEDKFDVMTKGELTGFERIYFNEQGNVVKHKIYSNDGSLLAEMISKYDSQGKESERVRYGYDGEVQERVLFTYNEAGKLSEYAVQEFWEGLWSYKTCYEYDADGNHIRTESYGDDGSVERRWTLSYNADGKVLESLCHTAQGVVDERKQYSYNAEGETSKVVVYNADNEPKQVLECKYDSAGNMIEFDVSQADSVLDRRLFFYDASGYRVKWERYSFDDIEVRIIYKNDSQGNIIEEQHFEGENLRPTKLIEYEIAYR